MNSDQDFQVRKATADDLSALLAIEQAIIEFERPFNDRLGNRNIHYYDLEAMLSSSKVNIQVIDAPDRDCIVASGFAEIRKQRSYFDHEQYAHFGFMYVDPNFRGKGLNGLIIDALKAWCRDLSVDYAYLTVYPQNTGAIKAYEKKGFNPSLLEMHLDLNSDSYPDHATNDEDQ